MSGDATDNKPCGDTEKPNFSGKWHTYLIENFEEFIKAQGKNWLVCKLASALKSQTTDFEIHHEGDRFRLHIQFILGGQDEEFTIGEPYTRTQPDGSVSEALAEWDGDTLVVKYKSTDGSNPGQTVERKLITPDEMQTTMTSNGVTCRRLAVRNK